MSKIEEIASKHLGKAGDGTVVKPYVTPETVDSSLLVGIPRYLNREAYQITDETFTGYDTWYAYEVSCLMQNGMPLNFILRVEYPSDSTCIVESKSFKLYLNSFNLMRVTGTIPEVIKTILTTIETDLSNAVGGNVDAELTVLGFDTGEPSNLNFGSVIGATTGSLSSLSCSGVTSMPVTGYNPLVNLEYTLMNMQGFNILDTEFDHYTASPELIKINPKCGNEIIHSYSLRSNCRVTNQPDWGDIYIGYSSDMSLDYVSLMQYIVSMRKENHFHEEICEAVFKNLKDAFKAAGAKLKDLAVLCNYSRRGGLDIRPVRATHNSTKIYELKKYVINMYKTEKQ